MENSVHRQITEELGRLHGEMTNPEKHQEKLLHDKIKRNAKQKTKRYGF